MIAEPRILTSTENVAFAPLPPDANTLAKHFLHRVAEYHDQPAMRKKRLGIWHEYMWSDSYAHVRDLCLGLVSLGVKRGDKVGLIGENDPEAYWSEIAVWSAGGTIAAIFVDAAPAEVAYILDNAEAVVLIAHDQEQVDKALAIRDQLPAVRHVLYWDERGVWNYNDPWLMPFAAVESLGRAYAEKHPAAFEALIAAGSEADIALLSYTSGTKSQPKGAMITHRNLIYGNRHATSLAPAFQSDNYLSFSSLAWITEQSLGVTSHLTAGMQVNFPESPETVQHDLREIAPSTLLFPSRLWENLASTTRVQLNDSSWLNRALYRLFLPVAYHVTDIEEKRQPVPLAWRMLRALGDIAIFHPLRDKLGMTRMRDAYTSGAALSPDVLRFFRAVGLELKNLYGSTECQVHTFHYTGSVRRETVGKPAPGVEIRINPDGELWIRSRSVFAGYYHDPDKTAQALDNDGWFHTGDAGYADEDGHLIYLDRLDDMIELASGERFSPQYIEGRLKFSPYIQDAMAVGGAALPFVSALINIDWDTVARWAEKRRLSFTTLVDLSQKPEVYTLIAHDVEAVNRTLPPAARLRRFVILHKAFDADDAELTRTRKLRRAALTQKYAALIEAMYADKTSVAVRADVRYRDGRTGTIETALHIADVPS